jgi:hypothetical protein
MGKPEGKTALVTGGTSGTGLATAKRFVEMRISGSSAPSRINSATFTWEAAAPPSNWRALVNRAERFHVPGAWARVMTFASFLTAAALILATH